MVRTAESCLRVAGGKSTRKGGNVSVRQESSRSRSPSSGSADRGSGGLNPICPRETPSWQKPITNFFISVDKSNYHSRAENQPRSSKTVPEDVNMVEDQSNPQTSEANKQSCIEPMDEEFQEIKINKNDGDKENSSPNEINTASVVNNGDFRVSGEAEMGEFSGGMKKKINAREDVDEEMVPAKRFKLDEDMYEHLQEVEQMTASRTDFFPKYRKR